MTAYGAGATVRYTTAEAFTNHFVGALRGKAVEAFKAAYRGVDVLLVDDVQFLQEKARTEQEFFHTFNALHQAGAQIVLTSDRLPRDLDALEERLRERFEAGLVTDVRAPDRATRLTILRKRVQQDDVGTIDPAALELIAERVADNVRALEGALVRVVAFGSLTGRARHRRARRRGARRPLPGAAQARRRDDRRARSRSAPPRRSASRSTRSSPPAAPAPSPGRARSPCTSRASSPRSRCPRSGSAFGGRNHTTVLHACRRTAERIAGDPDAFEIVRRLTRVSRRPRGARRDAAAADRLPRSCAQPPHSFRAAACGFSGGCAHHPHPL